MIQIRLLSLFITVRNFYKAYLCLGLVCSNGGISIEGCSRKFNGRELCVWHLTNLCLQKVCSSHIHRVTQTLTFTDFLDNTDLAPTTVNTTCTLTCH